MGVRSCNRHACEHIMCDKYSETYGYICEDCHEELVDYLVRKGVSHQRITVFMSKAPKSGKEGVHKEAVQAALTSIFAG